MDLHVSDETKRAEVLAVVTRLIRQVIDDEAGLGPPITFTTSFNQDLELESIEFVALAEKLKAEYGGQVGFAGWVAGVGLDQILALEVGQLVDLIAER